MLGHNERLARKLKEHGGARAWATVLESEKQWGSAGGANIAPGQAGSLTIHQKLKLRVEPDGEQSFDATIKQVFNDSHGWPIPEEGFSVQVIYDPNDRSKLVLDLDAVPVAPGFDRAEATARHEKAMARQMQGAAAIQETIAKGFTQSSGVTSGPDVADELTKLADLRDRGILTDAEFEAQKAKLLGAG